MSFDLTVYESGNGGDLVLGNGDLQNTASFYNMIYLAFFGGNVEAVTREDEPQQQQRFDYWANELLFPAQPGIQFNSQLENLLRESPITSASRLLIEDAARADLEFFREFGSVEVTTEILDVDRLQITATILEPDVIENKTFQFIWDSTKQEVIIEGFVGAPFQFPKRNILKNGSFNGTQNWVKNEVLNAVVAEFNGSLKITTGGISVYVIHSIQTWTPGRKYKITGNCKTFTVQASDGYGIGFGEPPEYLVQSTAGSFVPINGTGSFSAEVTAPENPSDPNDLRLAIGCPVNFAAGIFEIENLQVKIV